MVVEARRPTEHACCHKTNHSFYRTNLSITEDTGHGGKAMYGLTSASSVSPVAASLLELFDVRGGQIVEAREARVLLEVGARVAQRARHVLKVDRVRGRHVR